MKYIFCLFLLLGCIATYHPALAQSIIVKGHLQDTLNNTGLPKGSVVLIQAKDSFLVDFTRADNDGHFQLQLDTPGRYLLMATFPGFADYVDVFEVRKSGNNLGVIPMMTRSHLLNEFVYKAKRGAIQIKGDTIEYAADSFYVKDGASVEDLLKKLPGIQVDRSGNITAQGETVQKIYVDGEEFFSDDPAVVSKTLQARSVESVQVFDKKSEQAELTGVDDGVREKTINLKLKENSKRGYFGKVQAGGGTTEKYDNQLMVNAFKGVRKVSVFGIMSNTGRNGLSWTDRDQYMGGGNREFSEDGMVTTYEYDDDDNSFGGQQGQPKALTGGVHYSNKWLQGKHGLSSNYRFADNANTRDQQTITQYLLPENKGYTNTENGNSNTISTRHRGDFRYEFKPDSSVDIRLRANAGITFNERSSRNFSQSIGENGDTLNMGNNYNTDDSRVNSINSKLFIVKRFSKKGRSLSMDLEQWYRATEGNGLLQSQNTFYADSNITSQTFDQRKENNNANLNLIGTLNYTEPISKLFFAEANYRLAFNTQRNENLSYNKNNQGDYNQFDSSYSNQLDYTTQSHSGGAGLRFTNKIWNAYVGAQATLSAWEQNDLIRNTRRERNFTNYYPQAQLMYRPNQMRRFGFNYNGSTSQPSINQIAPLAQNSDALNVAIGNPNLNQQFRHNFRLNFSDYKVMTNTWKSINMGFTLVDEAISRSEIITESGARTYQYINVDGNYNGNIWAGLGSKWRKPDIGYMFFLSANTSRGVSIVNGLNNISNNHRGNLGFRISKDVEEKFSISYNPQVTYNYNKATISLQPQKYWSMNHTLNADVELPGKIDIETELDYNWRQTTPQFPDNNSLLYWNAAIVKKLLKSNDLHIRLSVNDILNQNKGFSRYANDNIITQRTYNTINRFAMLTVIWNFRWSPKPIEGEENAAQAIEQIN